MHDDLLIRKDFQHNLPFWAFLPELSGSWQPWWHPHGKLLFAWGSYGNTRFHNDDMKKCHIVICCIDDLTTDPPVVATLFQCLCSWYYVLAGAVHLHILTEGSVQLSYKIPAFSGIICAIWQTEFTSSCNWLSVSLCHTVAWVISNSQLFLNA